MIIFLSSSSTKLYKTDIIRSLAYPEYTAIQFRYDEKWVQSSEHCASKKGIICYLDSKDYTVVPIRCCQIVKFEKIHNLLFYTLELRGYPAQSCLDEKNLELDFPTKKSKGKYVLCSNLYNICAESGVSADTQDSSWIGIVDALAQCPDMQEMEYFYRFYSLTESRERKVPWLSAQLCRSA